MSNLLNCFGGEEDEKSTKIQHKNSNTKPKDPSKAKPKNKKGKESAMPKSVQGDHTLKDKTELDLIVDNMLSIIHNPEILASNFDKECENGNVEYKWHLTTQMKYRIDVYKLYRKEQEKPFTKLVLRMMETY